MKPYRIWCASVLSILSLVVGEVRGVGNPPPGPTEAPPAIPGNSESNRGSLGSSCTRGVLLFSREFTESAIDLRIRGRGLDLIWARRYGSRDIRITPMGYGWDHSYNISVELFGANRLIRDGNGRADVYLQTSPTTWANDQLPRELIQNPDLSYTLHFSDGGRWDLYQIDGSPTSGKIRLSADRNENSLQFFYDGLGRLAQIIDTLGRPFQIQYNVDGFISRVTDHTGRFVSYQYYTDPEPNGSNGDLKSVTAPEVLGTPTCNDFPSGKTMSYTYIENNVQPSVNHNLLTIRDPKGVTVLTNTYALSGVDVDRCTRQVMGPVGNIDLVHVTLVPGPTNNNAVRKIIVNDRMGNVKEVFFDAQNLGVMERDYTGRAPAPDNPTTDVLNRPVAPLRPLDPPFFETRYNYNANGMVTSILDHNGNTEQFQYLSVFMDPSPLARMNVQYHVWLAGPLGGDQPSISESFQYVPARNYVTYHSDGRGNSTFHLVDPNGNVLQTVHRGGLAIDDWTYNGFGQMTSHTLPDNGSGHRRMDTMTYGPDGYVQTSTVDATGMPMTTQYVYDPLGRVVQQTDPCGGRTDTQYNALDQIVRELSAEVSPGVRVETLTYYDANNNVVRVDVQNRDENGSIVPGNTHWTTINEYGLMNEKVRSCREVSGGNIPCTSVTCVAAAAVSTMVTTEQQYDANGQATLNRSAAAVDGTQPTNVVRTLNDERGLVYRVITAEGDPAASTTQYDYDGNRNMVRMTTGVGSPAPRVVNNAYDGFDRLTTTTDPMGNQVIYHYDANHNPVSVSHMGERLDVPGSALNVLLAHTETQYSAMDLAISSQAQHFDDTGAPIGDGVSATQTQYAPTGQVMAVIDDAGIVTQTVYNTANKPMTVTDPKGNTTQYTYDPCGNVTQIMMTDLSDLGGPPTVAITTNGYNGLNQLVSVTDASGTQTYAYDSRGNRLLETNQASVQTRYEYDGLARRVRTVLDMDGTGADGSAADIVSTSAYDANGRQTTQADGNTNATTYAYDALDRRVNVTYADTTTHGAVYDAFGGAVQTTDANGSVVTQTFDDLGRLTSRSIVPGPGVSNDTTSEQYAYDGLSRLVRAQDNDSLVTQAFDSLSRPIRETLNGETVESTWDGSGNKTSITYPGGRQVQLGHDGINRVASVSDNYVGGIATYAYAGTNRVVRRTFSGPGVDLDLSYLPGGAIGQMSYHQGLTILDRRTYQWSSTGNKTQRKDTTPTGPRYTHDYMYDSAGRMVHTIVSNSVSTVVRDTTYTLDKAGNRTNVAGPGTPNAGAYTRNPALPNPGDAQVNQYTTTPIDSRTYDQNGNLRMYGAPGCIAGDINNDGMVTPDDVTPYVTQLLSGGGTLCRQDTNSDSKFDALDTQGLINRILGGFTPTPSRNLIYDYRNRLIEYNNTTTGETTRYAYDALGRRISKQGVSTTLYFYDGWQLIEERSGGPATTYVWGNEVDELLTRRINGVDYYYLVDDLNSVVAVISTTGVVLQRFDYGDYGQPLDASALTPLMLFNPGSQPFYGFQGHPYDAESGLYHWRLRYMDPIVGRFIQRVVIGLWGDELGNGYTLLGNNPWSRLDPLGRGVWFYRWWWWGWYRWNWWGWWAPWGYSGYYCYYWWWWYPYRYWLWWWWPYRWYGFYYWWWSPYWHFCWYPYRWCWWPYRWYSWWYPYRWWGYHCWWYWWWYPWRCWVWYPYGGTWWWWWYPHGWCGYYWWYWHWWTPWRWYGTGWWWWYPYYWWGSWYGWYWCWPYRWYWWWWHWWWWPCGWGWQPYGWWGCWYDWWWCWYPYGWWHWWWDWWYPYGWWGYWYGWYWWWWPWGCWHWWWWYPYGWYGWWWGWYWWWWWVPYGWWWWWPWGWYWWWWW